MQITNTMASLGLALLVAITGVSPSLAQDQGVSEETGLARLEGGGTFTPHTPSSAVSPSYEESDQIVALLDAAADGCRVSIERESAVGQISEGYTPRLTKEIPACIAHEAMVTAYWQQQVALIGNLLDTELASTATTRDQARREAAQAANALAAVLTEGQLAAEVAMNRLEAERAVTPVTPIVAIDALGELEGMIDALALRIDEALTFQRNVCAANPGTSWCPR